MTVALAPTPAGLALLPAATVAEHRAGTSVWSRRGERVASVFDGALHALGRLTDQRRFTVADRTAVSGLLRLHPDAANTLLAGRAALLERLPGATFALEVDTEPGATARGLVAYAQTDVPAEEAVAALLAFYREWAVVQPAGADRAVAFDIRPL